MLWSVLRRSHEMTAFCLARMLILQHNVNSAVQIIQAGLSANPESTLLQTMLKTILDEQLRTATSLSPL